MRFSKPMLEVTKRLRGESAFCSVTRHELQNLAGQLEALENLAANKSPKDTEEAHLLKLEHAGDKLLKRQRELSARIQTRTTEAVRAIAEKMDAELGMYSSPYAHEIRSALRTMPLEQQQAAIKHAIDNKDGQFFRAISEAPPMLSGLTSTTVDNSMLAFKKKHAPELVRESEQVMEALNTSLSALDIPRRAVREGIDPAKLIEIKEAEARAEQAQVAFDAAQRQSGGI